MMRVVETTVGRALIVFDGSGLAFVTLFDEEGWEVEEGEWGDAEIDRGLFYVLGVPEDEATTIGNQVMEEWRQRGGAPTVFWEKAQDEARSLGGIAVLLAIVAIFVIGLVSIVRWIV
jgi:hypothetical protein